MTPTEEYEEKQAMLKLVYRYRNFFLNVHDNVISQLKEIPNYISFDKLGRKAALIEVEERLIEIIIMLADIQLKVEKYELKQSEVKERIEYFESIIDMYKHY
jgi:hypothetical protein